MTLTLEKIYRDVVKLALATLAYQLKDYATNNILHYALLFSAIGLFSFLVFNISKHYFPRFYNNHKITFLFTFFAIVIAVLIWLVYKYTGVHEFFWGILITCVVTWLATWITVLLKA